MIDEPAITLLTEKCGIDYQNYAYSSLRRRIEGIVHLQFNGDYLQFSDFLKNAGSKEITALVNSISVNTTEFYRDWGTWKSLIRDVIPALKKYNTIRIWHAGCSTGEEVYSMAILLTETGLAGRTKIVATDISEKALELARQGIYRDKQIEQNAENINCITGMEVFKKYFRTENGTWEIKKEMLPEITFRRKDLSNMEPFSKFDVIFCRNVMIYFNPELQKRIIELFAGSLFKNGCLITGKKESTKLVCDVDGFYALNEEDRIFRWCDV